MNKPGHAEAPTPSTQEERDRAVAYWHDTLRPVIAGAVVSGGRPGTPSEEVERLQAEAALERLQAEALTKRFTLSDEARRKFNLAQGTTPPAASTEGT